MAESKNSTEPFFKTLDVVKKYEKVVDLDMALYYMNLYLQY